MSARATADGRLFGLDGGDWAVLASGWIVAALAALLV